MNSRRQVRIPVRHKDKQPEHPSDTASSPEENPGGEVDWQDRAARLQAEMENFRKRQQRLADESADRARAALLEQFLPVVDALEMAVAHLRPDDAYDQNIKVALDELRRILSKAGVEPIPALGQPFDPQWHEAVAVAPAPAHQQHEMLVVEEEQKGYRLGQRILRPARVVVAKQP